ncbi:MAG: hypothetical protein IPI21_18990 [Propionivibrio sp.]|nr:hypothetical protein [Propionivibrio sp.]
MSALERIQRVENEGRACSMGFLARAVAIIEYAHAVIFKQDCVFVAIGLHHVLCEDRSYQCRKDGD